MRCNIYIRYRLILLVKTARITYIAEMIFDIKKVPSYFYDESALLFYITMVTGFTLRVLFLIYFSFSTETAISFLRITIRKFKRKIHPLYFQG